MARPAKPTSLKVLHGDREDRINRQEPVPSRGEIKPSRDLSPAAQRVWDRLAPDRIRAGVLTPWDVDAFGLFCEALVIAEQKLEGARKDPVPGTASPMAEFKTAMSIVSSLGGRFGWTPSERAQLKVDDGSKSNSKERLLS